MLMPEAAALLLWAAAEATSWLLLVSSPTGAFLPSPHPQR